MRAKLLTASLLLLVLTAGCEKQDDDLGLRPAGITFRTDSGYTYLGDTVHAGDTLLIGALVAEGSEDLQYLRVEMRSNGGSWNLRDSVPFTQNPMAVDVQAIMGAGAHTEEWGFTALEPDGDGTFRSLTFTVTE
jgi:hypothetical protein